MEDKTVQIDIVVNSTGTASISQVKSELQALDKAATATGNALTTAMGNAPAATSKSLDTLSNSVANITGKMDLFKASLEKAGKFSSYFDPTQANVFNKELVSMQNNLTNLMEKAKGVASKSLSGEWKGTATQAKSVSSQLDSLSGMYQQLALNTGKWWNGMESGFMGQTANMKQLTAAASAFNMEITKSGAAFKATPSVKANLATWGGASDSWKGATTKSLAKDMDDFVGKANTAAIAQQRLNNNANNLPPAIDKSNKGLETKNSLLDGSFFRVARLIIAYQAIYGVVNLIGSGVRLWVDTLSKGIETVADYQMNIISGAALMTSLADKSIPIEKAYAQSKEYMTWLNRAAREVDQYVASGAADIVKASQEMISWGVVPVGKEQVKQVGQVVDALKVATKGIGSQSWQLYSEIRNLFAGDQARLQGSQLLQMLLKVDPEVKEKIEGLRATMLKTGDAAPMLTYLVTTLRGFGAASGDIEMQWFSLLATMKTGFDWLLVNAFTPATEQVVKWGWALLDVFYKEGELTAQGKKLSDAIRSIWEENKGQLEGLVDSIIKDPSIVTTTIQNIYSAVSTLGGLLITVADYAVKLINTLSGLSSNPWLKFSLVLGMITGAVVLLITKVAALAISLAALEIAVAPLVAAATAIGAIAGAAAVASDAFSKTRPDAVRSERMTVDDFNSQMEQGSGIFIGKSEEAVNYAVEQSAIIAEIYTDLIKSGSVMFKTGVGDAGTLFNEDTSKAGEGFISSIAAAGSSFLSWCLDAGSAFVYKISAGMAGSLAGWEARAVAASMKTGGFSPFTSKSWSAGMLGSGEIGAGLADKAVGINLKDVVYPPKQTGSGLPGKKGGGGGGGSDGEPKRLLSIFDTLTKDIARLSEGKFAEVEANLAKTLDQIHGKEVQRNVTKEELIVLANKRASLQKLEVEDQYQTLIAKGEKAGFLKNEVDRKKALRDFGDTAEKKLAINKLFNDNNAVLEMQAQEKSLSFRKGYVDAAASAASSTQVQLGLQKQSLELDIAIGNSKLEQARISQDISEIEYRNAKQLKEQTDEYRKQADIRKGWMTQGMSGGAKEWAMTQRAESETYDAKSTISGLNSAKSFIGDSIAGAFISGLKGEKVQLQDIGYTIAGGFVKVLTDKLMNTLFDGIANMILGGDKKEGGLGGIGKAAGAVGEGISGLRSTDLKKFTKGLSDYTKFEAKDMKLEVKQNKLFDKSVDKMDDAITREFYPATTDLMESAGYTYDASGNLIKAGGMGLDAAGMNTTSATMGTANSIAMGVSAVGMGLAAIGMMTGSKELSIAGMVISAAAQLMMLAAATGIFHTGGIVAHTGGVLTAHSGMLLPDERIIKAQTGEGVLQRSAMAKLGKNNFMSLNNGDFSFMDQVGGGSGSGNTYNVSVNVPISATHKMTQSEWNKEAKKVGVAMDRQLRRSGEKVGSRRG